MADIAVLMESLVARITAAGAASAIFAYLLVRGLVRPWTNAKFKSEPWKGKLITNAITLVIACVTALALVYILTLLTETTQWVEALLIGVIGFGVATYGHEVLKNWGGRKAEEEE